MNESFYTLTGSAAFILTAVYTAVRFAIYLNMIVGATPRKPGLLLTYFTLGITTHAAWIIYLWPLHDLYILIGLSLNIMSDGIFLMLGVVVHRRNNLENHRRSASE